LPGYEIVLQTNGDQQYHTDESGNNLVLAEIPRPEISDVQIAWSERMSSPPAVTD
jgi:hypothetical protein